MISKRKFTKKNELVVIELDGEFKLCSLDGRAEFDFKNEEYEYVYCDVASDDHKTGYAPESTIISLEDFYNLSSHPELNTVFIKITEKNLKYFGRLGMLTGKSYTSGNKIHYKAYLADGADNWITNDRFDLAEDQFVTLDKYFRGHDNSKPVMKEIKFESAGKDKMKEIEELLKTLSRDELQTVKKMANAAMIQIELDRG